MSDCKCTRPLMIAASVGTSRPLSLNGDARPRPPRQHLRRASGEDDVYAVLSKRRHRVFSPRRARAPAPLQLHAQADVRDLHVPGAVHEQVLRLEIVVRDAPGRLRGVVQPRDALRDGRENVHPTRRRHRLAVPRDVLAQRLRAQLERDEQMRGRDPPAVEKRHARGLVQRGEELHLALDELEKFATLVPWRPRDALHRDGVPRPRRVLDVASEHVRAAAADADDFLFVVYDRVADAAPGRGRGGVVAPGAAAAAVTVAVAVAAAAGDGDLLPGAALVRHRLRPRGRGLVRVRAAATVASLRVLTGEPAEPARGAHAALVQLHGVVVPV
eukprot:30306-Pelagococcus_subviridis.AAC.5